MNNSDSAVTPVAATVTRPEHVFPTLTSGQVARMAAHGRLRRTTRGEVLVEVGDTAVPVFVVVRGELRRGRSEPRHAAWTVRTGVRLGATGWKPFGEARGVDVGTDGIARFDRSGMIRLVAGAPRRRHVLTLSSSDAGLRAYVFTFGP